MATKYLQTMSCDIRLQSHGEENTKKHKSVNMAKLPSATSDEDKRIEAGGRGGEKGVTVVLLIKNHSLGFSSDSQ
jgi:hypothetical protein